MASPGRRKLILGLIGAVGLSGAGAIAIGLQGGSGDDGAAGDSPDGGSPPTGTVGEKTVRVVVTVVGPDGPVAGERVVLRDPSGSLDVREKHTGPDGTVTFDEGVGPPPCNHLEVRLPDRGRRRELGCYDGPATVTERIVVG